MARPRVFISSTYFDLKSVRADLERFILDMGYEPVLHERGHIPYGNQKALEAYCYREIDHCDILVSIVGGRFGSQAKDEEYSVSQIELKTAVALNRHCYVFVERDVLGEFKTYRRNKNNVVEYDSVDNVRVFSFLEEVYALGKNNKIIAFETSKDIIGFLKEQWAGLFQQLLSQSAKEEQVSLLTDMRTSIKTLGELVVYLTEQRDHGNAVVEEILLSNHPIFGHLRKLLDVRYRVYFTNVSELGDWVRARSYRAVDPDEWDEPDYIEWLNKKDDPQNWRLLKVSKSLFDDQDRLKPMNPSTWSDKLIALVNLPQSDNDEIPF